MKRNFWIFILGCLFIILLPAILAIGIKQTSDGFQPSLSDTEILYNNILVSQSFTAKHNNLSAVALTVKNPLLRNKKDLIFNLMTEDGLSRQVIINGTNIYDGDYVYFRFEPIPNSENKNIIMNFTSPNTAPDEAYELYHTEKTSVGKYLVNNLEKPGQLSFVSYYSPENIIELWITVYQNWFLRLFQDLPFAIFYIFSIIAMMLYLLINRKRFN